MGRRAGHGAGFPNGPESSTDLLRVFLRQKLRFFLVGVDLQGDLHAFFFRRDFQHVADGGCGKTIAPNEHGHIRRGQNELETQLFRSQLGDFQLRLCGIVDQFDGDVLEKVPQSFGSGLHGRIMTTQVRFGKSGFIVCCFQFSICGYGFFPVRTIAILLAMVTTALSVPSDPGTEAIRFLEKIRGKTLNLAPGGDTALAPQTSEKKRLEISRRLDRMVQDLGKEPLQAGSVKLDGDLAAVLIGKSSTVDPDAFQVFPVAMIKRNDAWIAAPVPASFENSGVGFEPAVRARTAALEDWMLRQQSLELEKLRSGSMASLRAEVEKSLPTDRLKSLGSNQVFDLFLASCAAHDLPVVLGLLGGTSATPPDDWAQRLKIAKAAITAADKAARPWRLLISKHVLRVPVRHEESENKASFTLACLDPAGIPPTPEKPEVEWVRFTLSKTPDGLWRVDPPAAFLIHPPPKPDEALDDDSEVASPEFFSTGLTRLYPATPSPTAKQARESLTAAFGSGNPTDWVKLLQIPSDPAAAMEACAVAARLWWDLSDPTALRHARPLGDHESGDHAACAFQLFSFRNPDHLNLQIVYFAKTPMGWLWEPAPTQEIVNTFQDWRTRHEKEWKDRWREDLMAGCVELEKIPTTKVPTEEEARKLIESWITATRTGDLAAAVKLTARLREPDSKLTLLRNLGYEISDARGAPAPPTVTAIQRGDILTAVGVQTTRAGKPAFPLYPVVLTPLGPRILLEIDLLASDNRSREYLNKESLEKLRESSPAAADDLKKLFSEHRARTAAEKQP